MIARPIIFALGLALLAFGVLLLTGGDVLAPLAMAIGGVGFVAISVDLGK